MARPLAGGEQPYPEPVQPPAGPLEAPPIDAPQEEPPATPFNDGGRPVDEYLADFQSPHGGELVA